MFRPYLNFIKSDLHLDRWKTRFKRNRNGICNNLCCLPSNYTFVCHHECCVCVSLKTLKTLLAVLDVRTRRRHVKEQMDNFHQYLDLLSIQIDNGLDHHYSLNGRHCLVYRCNEHFTRKFLDSFPLYLLQFKVHIFYRSSWKWIDICKLFHDVSL